MKNNGTIKGKLYNIEIKGQTEDFIAAVVFIEIAKDNIFPVQFRASVLNFAGEPTKTYPAFMKFLEDAKSVVNDNDEADFVEVKRVTLEENMFSVDGKTIISDSQVKGKLFSKIPATEGQGAITITGLVKGIRDEIVDELPTGALHLDIEHIATFGQMKAHQLHLHVENIGTNVAFIKANYVVGQEVTLTVEPTMLETTKTTVVGSGFGGDITETKQIKVKRLSVTQGTTAGAPLLANEAIEEARSARTAQETKAKERYNARNTKKVNTAKAGGTPQFSL